MKNNWKIFGIGLIGGLLPMAAFMVFSSGLTSPQSDTILGGSSDSYAYGTNLNSMQGLLTDDFVAASENSLNSVVHVTTKVVTTSFQRDIFSEFFYGPGAGGKEFKQYGAGSGSGVIITEDG